MRKRYVAPLLACVSLVVPASASAHARTATVALDYRLVLDSATKRSAGVSVAILDGDRDLRLRVHGTTVVVRGDLGEPMLRLEPSGTWVNRASVTAAAERLTTPGHGWKRIASGSSFTWHEHRLGPPPYDGSRLGRVARFAIPGDASTAGRSTIGGMFVRYARPPLWPWLLGAVALAAAVAVVVRASARAAVRGRDRARRGRRPGRARRARGVRRGRRAERAGRVAPDRARRRARGGRVRRARAAARSPAGAPRRDHRRRGRRGAASARCPSSGTAS